AQMARSVSRAPVRTNDLAQLFTKLGGVLADLESESSKMVHLSLSTHSVFAAADMSVTVLPLGIVELGRKCELVRFYRKLRGEADWSPEIAGVERAMQFGLGQIAIDLLLGERASRPEPTLGLAEQLAKVMRPSRKLARLADVLGRLTAPEPDRFPKM